MTCDEARAIGHLTAEVQSIFYAHLICCEAVFGNQGEYVVVDTSHSRPRRSRFSARTVARNTRVPSIRSDGSNFHIHGQSAFLGAEPDLAIELTNLVSDSESSLIVTPNVDQVVLARSDAKARSAISAASLLLLDGMPLVYLARSMGVREARRHTGADLLPACARLAVRNNWTIAIAGGDPLTAAQAAARLQAENHGARVVSVEMPHISTVADPQSRAAVDELSRLQPDLTFLCMGFPKQESWYLHWQDSLPKSVYVGAGAAVDFAAGSKARAPRLVQRMSLEWLFRFGQEPRRMAYRYFVRDMRFLPIALECLRQRYFSAMRHRRHLTSK